MTSFILFNVYDKTLNKIKDYKRLGVTVGNYSQVETNERGGNKKSPDNVRAFTRVKDGARTRDLRNHNPAL